MQANAPSFGVQLRDWRQRRRLSQLDLACEAGVSSRHISFLETGRSNPSREMIQLLAEMLAVPLRERNALLLAAGFAPAFPVRQLDDRALAPARRAVDLILAGHDPFPALAVDRGWHLVAANAGVGKLLVGVPPAMLQPPVNVLRLSLHPDGLAPRIVNLGDWRHHVLQRLDQQIAACADPGLMALRDELAGLARGGTRAARDGADPGGIAVPLVLESPAGRLSFISTTTVFGTPVDVTLAEIAIESFFPADAATGERLQALPPAG